MLLLSRYPPPAKAQAPTAESFTAFQETHELLKSRMGSVEPMPEPLMNEMETGFGADFSNLNIHRDSASSMWDRFRGTQESEKPLRIGEELKGERKEAAASNAAAEMSLEWLHGEKMMTESEQEHQKGTKQAEGKILDEAEGAI